MEQKALLLNSIKEIQDSFELDNVNEYINLLVYIHALLSNGESDQEILSSLCDLIENIVREYTNNHSNDDCCCYEFHGDLRDRYYFEERRKLLDEVPPELQTVFSKKLVGLL